MGLDIGPKAVDYFTDTIKNSKTVLWNGPMGVFEMSKFENGTKSVAASLADATSNGAFTLMVVEILQQQLRSLIIKIK